MAAILLDRRAACGLPASLSCIGTGLTRLASSNRLHKCSFGLQLFPIGWSAPSTTAATMHSLADHECAIMSSTLCLSSGCALCHYHAFSAAAAAAAAVAAAAAAAAAAAQDTSVMITMLLQKTSVMLTFISFCFKLVPVRIRSQPRYVQRQPAVSRLLHLGQCCTN